MASRIMGKSKATFVYQLFTGYFLYVRTRDTKVCTVSLRGEILEKIIMLILLLSVIKSTERIRIHYFLVGIGRESG